MAQVVKTVGTVASVVSIFKGGNEQKRVAYNNSAQITDASEHNAKLLELEATQHDRNANNARAIAQRKAIEEKRQAKVIMSRAMAVAGASGGGVFGDVSVENDLAGILEVGEYNAKTALWEGEESALNSEDNAFMRRRAANITRYEGNLRASNVRREGDYAQDSSRLGGVIAAIDGGSSIYSRYKTNKAAGKAWYS